MAWWHTAPRSAKPQDKSLTRIEAERINRKDKHWTPPLPWADAGYLISHLWEVGPALPGMEPITHGELAAWCELTGVDLEPWEARTLRRLSREYVAEAQRAADPGATSPVAVEMTDEDRKRVSDAVSSGLRMLMKTRPKRW